MRLVPASLQSYVSEAIKFFQIHEEDAALHTFLLHLDTLRADVNFIENTIFFQYHKQFWSGVIV